MDLHSHISLRNLAVIALVSTAILLISIYRPAARDQIAPSSAIDFSPRMQMLGSFEESSATASAAVAPLQPLSSVMTPRGQLSVSSASGLFSVEDEARLGADLERALSYVSERFGSGPSDTINAQINWEPSCGLHGIAYTQIRNTQVFTCPDLPRNRAVNIMAHEFVHQLAQDRYGDAHLGADVILLEGVATWGAGEYWLGGSADFRSFVRPWLQNGSSLPLGISYVGRSISDMNTLYYQWGSFVEFLIQTYGREKFDALYVSGSNNAPASADYFGVYGKSFADLELEWRAWVLE